MYAIMPNIIPKYALKSERKTLKIQKNLKLKILYTEPLDHETNVDVK